MNEIYRHDQFIIYIHQIKISVI